MTPLSDRLSGEGPAPFTSYTEADVMEALDEALLEVERERRTDLWASFWDRLTMGDWLPKRPDGGT